MRLIILESDQQGMSTGRNMIIKLYDRSDSFSDRFEPSRFYDNKYKARKWYPVTGIRRILLNSSNRTGDK